MRNALQAAAMFVFFMLLLAWMAGCFDRQMP